MRTVTMEHYDLARTLRILGVAVDVFDELARAEARREAEKPMRCVTAQRRAQNARRLLDEMCEKYGVDTGRDEAIRRALSDA